MDLSHIWPCIHGALRAKARGQSMPEEWAGSINSGQNLRVFELLRRTIPVQNLVPPITALALAVPLLVGCWSRATPQAEVPGVAGSQGPDRDIKCGLVQYALFHGQPHNLARVVISFWPPSYEPVIYRYYSKAVPSTVCEQEKG